MPRLFLASVLECEGEDAVARLDGCFAVGGGCGQGGLDCVEGGGGRKVVWKVVRQGRLYV